MPLPKKDYQGQIAYLSMMEFRKGPGDAIDRVAHGMTIVIERNSKAVALLVPVAYLNDDETTEVHRDGSITGPIPLTYRRHLGSGGYGD